MGREPRASPATTTGACPTPRNCRASSTTPARPTPPARAAIDPVFEASAITNEGGRKDFPCYWTGTTHARGRGGAAAAYVAFGRGSGWMQSPPDPRRAHLPRRPRRRLPAQRPENRRPRRLPPRPRPAGRRDPHLQPRPLRARRQGRSPGPRRDAVPGVRSFGMIIRPAPTPQTSMFQTTQNRPLSGIPAGVWSSGFAARNHLTGEWVAGELCLPGAQPTAGTRRTNSSAGGRHSQSSPLMRSKYQPRTVSLPAATFSRTQG